MHHRRSCFPPVLTNDLHQDVFSFPSDVRTDVDYRYEAGFRSFMRCFYVFSAFIPFVVKKEATSIDFFKSF